MKTIHTARTMMFSELEKVMDFGMDSGSFVESLKQNVTAKKSRSGVEYTGAFLKKLYGFDIEYAPFKAFRYFWKISEHTDKPLLAFIYAVNHDDMLAESVDVIAEAKEGLKVAVVLFEMKIEKIHPNRYSPKTRKSMAQNLASSWKQAGFIEGKVKNIRVQPEINFRMACFALLLAYLKGDRGDYIWNSTGIKALCLSESKVRELAMECARRDLMEYQHAGNITAISFNNLLKKIGIDAVEN